MSNLEFWNSVCTTDPAHTKKVKLGRAFTAIDPMYQVMKATEAMGMVTKEWGFNVQEVQYLPTDQVAIRVRVWKGDKESYIEQWGQNGLYIDNKKTMPDTDCMKKATTDGLTKCLSYFGFNADVFLGKFDDNKYVEEQTRAHQKLEDANELYREIKTMFNLNKSKTKETFLNWCNSEQSRKERAKLKSISEDSYLTLKAEIDIAIKEFDS